MKRFSAHIGIIGVNPVVHLPEKVLAAVLREAGKDKGPIRHLDRKASFESRWSRKK